MRVLASSKEKVKLDLIDRKILFLLSVNARFSYSTIAKHVKLSREAIKQRINKLVKKKVVLGFQTAINHQLLSYNSYHVFLQLNNPEQKVEEKMVSDLVEDNDVNALLKYEGRYDFEISYLLKDIKELNEKLKGLSTQNIKDYNFFILLNTISFQTYSRCLHKLDLDVKNIRHDGSFFSDLNKNKSIKINLDEQDKKLLRIISDEARISMTELATRLKLSVDSVIYRIKKLIGGKIILGFRPIINYANLGYSVYCVFFRFKNLNKEKEDKFNYFFKTHSNVLWSANFLGPFNNISYLIVKDSFEYHEVIKDIRENFFEIIDNYESLLAFAEYKYSFFPRRLVEK